jgi:hypothetical protein
MKVVFTIRLPDRQDAPTSTQRRIMMSARSHASWPRLAYTVFVMPATALMMLVAMADADRGPSLEAVRTRLKQQSDRIDSLHLRVRRITTLCVAPEVLATWPSRTGLPKYLGTDEVLVAFKGHKRYSRLLELDYRSNALARKFPLAAMPTGAFVDSTKVWTGTMLRERDAGPVSDGGREYRSVSASDAHDCFPPSPYLMHVGMAVADPTASDEAHRNLQQLHCLAELVQHWPYTVSRAAEDVGGTPCVVLQGAAEISLPVGGASRKRSISDRLWLDPDHGLALRKRELQIDGQLVRVVNTEFDEVLQGVWLPKHSRVEVFPAPDAPAQYRDRPLLTEEMTLCLAIVNKVPDDLFEAVAKPPPESVPAPEGVAAWHVRRMEYGHRGEDPTRDEILSTSEMWWRRGVGVRAEYRTGLDLTALTVETPRWRFFWRAAENRAVASPGTSIEDAAAWQYSTDRESIFYHSEVVTGAFATEKDQLDGREVEKVTVYLPPEADSSKPGLCAHVFVPEKHRFLSGTEFRARVYRFDPKTGLPLQRLCGCKRPLERGTHDERIDYPAQRSMPRELFTFRVPDGVVLEVNDPELGRQFRPPGETQTATADKRE